MSGMGIAIFVWAGLVVLFSACSCASVATQRGRDPVIWFFLGLIFGPVAQIAIGSLERRVTQETSVPASYPTMICPNCKKTMRIGGNCPHCGYR